jgi:CBS-domain-containing membrane protein
MLTLTDVARTEHLEGGQPATLTEYAWGDSEELEDVDPEEVFYRKDNYSPEVLGRALVGDWMSRGVVSVPPDASLQRVCEVMVREQIHRVCVTVGDRLVGLVTSFDVVRHVAGARPARSSTRTRRARHRGTGGSVGRE